jgi:prephenate dehydrogenase
MDPEPPFRSVAIVGLGLIGGSLALATRERWPAVQVTGIDSDAVIAHVRGSGAIDRSATRLSDIAEVDLIVLAAPVQENLELLAQVGQRGGVVTDVGSTKRVMVEAGRQLQSPAVFVGGHPLGGAERGGFAYARSDLFDGRPWIFTPDATTAPPVVAGLTAFVAGIGAKPVIMTAEAHDRAMAFLSHLPQLTASALMEVVGESTEAQGLALAGRGLMDTTRLASSPANVWRDVCHTNADAIGDALDALIGRLLELRGSLRQPAAIDALFSDAARWRGVLMKGRE